MLNLNTHLTLETIKNNVALQGIQTDRLYLKRRKTDGMPAEWDKLATPRHIYNDIVGIEGYAENELPAPTIADIISNAEELFGMERRCPKCWKTADEDDYHNDCGRCLSDYEYSYKIISQEILKGCQQDKPLQEIEKYIISNLK